MRKLVPALCLLGSLLGCATDVPMQRLPAETLQLTWQGAPPDAVAAEAEPADGAAEPAWWTAFGDPVLEALIAKARDANLDILRAQARVLLAAAQAAGADAGRRPSLSGALDTSVSGDSSKSGSRNAAEVGLIASWEIDLFGRLKAEADAAHDELAASRADEDAVRRAIVAEVARSYVEYRLFRAQERISALTAQSQAETERITRARFEEGMGSRVDVERSAALLATTRAAVPDQRQQAEAAKHRLVLLTASTPEAIDTLLGDPSGALGPMSERAVLRLLHTPSQVIVNRPDVKAAELRLSSAAARHRAALRLRYPSVSLAALIGWSEGSAAVLAAPGAATWSLGASVLAPVIDFGRIRASIDAADALQQEAYLGYEASMRRALQEAQTAIVGYVQGRQAEQELARAVEASRIAAELAREQFAAGALSPLEVTDAERSLFAAELSRSQASAEVALRLIAVYQATGAPIGS